MRNSLGVEDLGYSHLKPLIYSGPVVIFCYVCHAVIYACHSEWQEVNEAYISHKEQLGICKQSLTCKLIFFMTLVFIYFYFFSVLTKLNTVTEYKIQLYNKKVMSYSYRFFVLHIKYIITSVLLSHTHTYMYLVRVGHPCEIMSRSCPTWMYKEGMFLMVVLVCMLRISESHKSEEWWYPSPSFHHPYGIVKKKICIWSECDSKVS